MKYIALGKKAENFLAVDKLLDCSNRVSLPKFHTTNLKGEPAEYELNTSHSYLEADVQTMTTDALCNKLIGQYYVHDTYKRSTFLGSDLRPHFMISTDSNVNSTEGEFNMAFMIDVEAYNVNPASVDCIGQATAYGIRALERSSPLFRTHVTIIVTNLIKATIVQVGRNERDNCWEFKQARTTATEALSLAFSSSLAELGYRCPHTTHKVDPTNLLGCGSTGIVYETRDGNVVKFFRGENGDAKRAALNAERTILSVLNDELTRIENPSKLCIQQVVCHQDMDGITWPYLVMSPLGKVYPPNAMPTWSLSAFMHCLEVLQFSHSIGIIHNDIRPENILVVDPSLWIIIDWTAAWKISSNNLLKVGQEEYKGAYAGCVTFAADSVLNSLADCATTIDEKLTLSDSLSRTWIARASIVTDLIALLRSAFFMAYRVSDEETQKLCKHRNDHNFIAIVEWWAAVLPNSFKTCEEQLQTVFEEQRNDVHKVLKQFVKAHLPNSM